MYRTLDYICQQLEQLTIVRELSNDLARREFVINRALDVRSAIMLFLALNINHDSTFLAIPGTERESMPYNDIRKNRKSFLYWR